tara:strand:+ start:773 stop:907 length:135 start_codon:yes stop_codon:yes gene_type:complete
MYLKHDEAFRLVAAFKRAAGRTYYEQKLGVFDESTFGKDLHPFS